MKYIKFILCVILFLVFFEKRIEAYSITTDQIIEVGENVSFEFQNNTDNKIYDLSYQVHLPHNEIFESDLVEVIDIGKSDNQFFKFSQEKLEEGRYLIYVEGSYLISNNPYNVKFPTYFISSHIIEIDVVENNFEIRNERIILSQQDGFIEFDIVNKSNDELNLMCEIILPKGIKLADRSVTNEVIRIKAKSQKRINLNIENQWRNIGDSSEALIKVSKQDSESSEIKKLDFIIEKKTKGLANRIIGLLLFIILFLLFRFYFKFKQRILNIIFLVFIFFLMVEFLPVKYIFWDTSTTGGDTIFHYIAARVMREDFLPNLKVTSWYQGNYAGFPLFTFYGPLPFLISSLLSLIINFNISFKITTLLGVFFTPLAVYILTKCLKLSNLACLISSVLSLLFVFNESYSMYGGNLLSTLAGEFGFSISLTLLIVFAGYIYKGIIEKKYSKFNAFLLFLVGFAHPLPFVLAIVIQIFFLLPKFHSWSKIKDNFYYLVKVNFVAFLLIAFWAIPMVLRMDYTTALDEFWPVKFKEIFPNNILPFFVISVISSFYAIIVKKKEIIYLIFIVYVSCIFIFISDKIGLVNIRFIPSTIIFILIIAGYGISLLSKHLKIKYLNTIILLITSLLVTIFLIKSINVAPGWFKWNYTGIENKPFGDRFYEMINYIKNLPGNDRIVYEHSTMQENFGTNRTFESLYYFTKKPTHEGLYIQSSSTSPFIYYMQSELSEISTHVIVGNEYSDFNEDFKRMVSHLETFNVRYYLAVSDEVKDRLSRSIKFKKLKEFHPYAIFEFVENENNYVELVNVSGVSNSLDWKSFSYDKFINEPQNTYIEADTYDYNENKNCSEANIEVKSFRDDYIAFKTDALGCPHLIKISYFPKWKVVGAFKIYKATPNFMLVYPEKEYVELKYQNLFIDNICITLSIIGWIYILFQKRIFSLSKKKLVKLFKK